MSSGHNMRFVQQIANMIVFPILFSFVANSAMADDGNGNFKEDARAAAGADVELIKMIAPEVAAAAKANEGQTDTIPPVSVETLGADVAPVPAAVVAATTTAPAPQVKLKESEIPVLTSAKSKKAEAGSSAGRVILSFVVMGLMAGGLIYFSRHYKRNVTKAADNHKIRVLTQHYLGPKKSLVIVRVAGESILLGVTDQNISMIKSLSFIDEEMPDAVPTHFQDSMNVADQIASPNVKLKNEVTGSANAKKVDQVDDFVLNTIKDKVTVKLKNMRSI